jgi:nitrogen fixation NifU-like protein
MSQDLYQEIILEEFKHPHHQGIIENADLVLTGGNASCGDQVKIYLKIQDEQIIDLKWEGNGCAISQASMSVLSQKIIDEHLSLVQVKAMIKNDMLELLGLEEITAGREKCLMMGLKTLQKDEN